MKLKKKLIGSYLCFGAPDTLDSDAVDRKPKDNDSFKAGNRKLISKIVRSLSLNSISMRKSASLRKYPSQSLIQKISDSESIGKSSDGTIFTSSSSSSSSSSLSYVPEPDIKYPCKMTTSPSKVRINIGYATGFCLLLVSLIVLVFCGRLIAILWTATWLCLVPRRRMAEKLTEGDDLVPENVTENRRKLDEDNRRVVLEGFLQRNRKKGNKVNIMSRKSKVLRITEYLE